MPGAFAGDCQAKAAAENLPRVGSEEALEYFFADLLWDTWPAVDHLDVDTIRLALAPDQDIAVAGRIFHSIADQVSQRQAEKIFVGADGERFLQCEGDALAPPLTQRHELPLHALGKGARVQVVEIELG